MQAYGALQSAEPSVQHKEPFKTARCMNPKGSAHKKKKNIQWQ